MFKAILVSLCLTLAVTALGVHDFLHVNPTIEEMEELFQLYIVHQAPIPIEPTFERFEYFYDEVKSIVAHNRDPTKTWKQSITQFTGLTADEMRGIAIMASQNCSATNTQSLHAVGDIPASFDWRQYGVVSPVKNQGKCGSCWTFSTTGAVEANWAITQGVPPPNLSEQQLVECAGDFNNHGCNGGLPSQAFEYIKFVGGLEGEVNYPYVAGDGTVHTCSFDSSKIIAKVPFGSVNITAGDEDGIQQAVATVGPVSIAFQVIDGFKNYAGGVYAGENCGTGPQDVNHAVLVVGYGHDTNSNMDYWIIKNSWGVQWGEQGYFRMERGVNMCGIAVCAAYPNITGKN